MATSSSAAGDGGVGAAAAVDEQEIAWYGMTAALGDSYAPLQWLLPTTSQYVLVAPVEADPGTITVALQAEVAPGPSRHRGGS